MKNNKPILLIDGQNLAWRAYFSHARLSYNGQSVSVIFGLLQILGSAIKKHKPKDIIIAWDGGRNKVRKKLNPNYKGNRDRPGLELTDREDFERQRKIVMAMLNLLGIKQILEPGVEADDWIYLLTQEYDNQYKIIISNDKDFDQLINRNTHVYNEKKNITVLLTEENLKEVKGYYPHNAVDYLILVGDNSDNISGVNGVGEKTAVLFLDAFGSIRSFLKNDSNSFPRVNRDKILEVYEINRRLIDLRYFGRNILKNKKLTYYLNENSPKFRPNEFKKMAAKYQMIKIMGIKFIDLFKLP